MRVVVNGQCVEGCGGPMDVVGIVVAVGLLLMLAVAVLVLTALVLDRGRELSEPTKVDPPMYRGTVTGRLSTGRLHVGGSHAGWPSGTWGWTASYETPVGRFPTEQHRGPITGWRLFSVSHNVGAAPHAVLTGLYRQDWDGPKMHAACLSASGVSLGTVERHLRRGICSCGIYLFKRRPGGLGSSTMALARCEIPEGAVALEHVDGYRATDVEIKQLIVGSSISADTRKALHETYGVPVSVEETWFPTS